MRRFLAVAAALALAAAPSVAQTNSGFSFSFPVQTTTTLKLALVVNGSPYDLNSYLASGGSAMFQMVWATGSGTVHIVNASSVGVATGDPTNVASIVISASQVADTAKWAATFVAGNQTWTGTVLTLPFGAAASATTNGVVTAATPAPASSTSIGGVLLSGDLSGTASSPQVVSAHLAAPLPQGQGGSGAATLGEATVTPTGASTARPLANKLGDTVSVKDFCGETPPTDAATCLQSAFTAVSVSGTLAGKNLYIPTGTYNYSTQILANQLKSIMVWGDGARNTILHWTGAASGTAFKCQNCYKTIFRGLRFDVGANNPVNVVAVVEDSTQGDYDASAPSQSDVFEECTFVGGTFGLAFDFVTNDIMNDTHRVVDGLFSAATTAAVFLNGQNAMGLVFERPYSINSPRFIQVQANGGSFKVFGGYVNNSVANFDLAGFSSDGYVVIGTRSESSPRFWSYTNGSATPGPVLLEGIAYSAQSLNADTFAINANGGGPYTINGGTWGGAGAVDTVAPRFSIASIAATPIPVVITGVSFGGNSADTVTPLINTTGNRVCARGNRYKVGATSVWKTLVEECFAPADRQATLTYTSGVAIAVDATLASVFKLVVNDTVAVVINAPTGGTAWQSIRIWVKATAAMNAANPFAGTGWKAGTVPVPTSGNGYVYTFMYDGTNWTQVGTPNLVAN